MLYDLDLKGNTLGWRSLWKWILITAFAWKPNTWKLEIRELKTGLVGTPKPKQYATSVWLSLTKSTRKNRSITLTVNFIFFFFL